MAKISAHIDSRYSVLGMDPPRLEIDNVPEYGVREYVTTRMWGGGVVG